MFEVKAGSGRVDDPVQVLSSWPLTTASCLSAPVAKRVRTPVSALTASLKLRLLLGAAVMAPELLVMVGKASAKAPLVRRPPTLA